MCLFRRNHCKFNLHNDEINSYTQAVTYVNINKDMYHKVKITEGLAEMWKISFLEKGCSDFLRKFHSQKPLLAFPFQVQLLRCFVQLFLPPGPTFLIFPIFGMYIFQKLKYACHWSLNLEIVNKIKKMPQLYKIEGIQHFLITGYVCQTALQFSA